MDRLPPAGLSPRLFLVQDAMPSLPLGRRASNGNPVVYLLPLTAEERAGSCEFDPR